MKRVVFLASLAALLIVPVVEAPAQEMAQPTGQKTLAATMNVYVFPTQGQAAEQQSKDEMECYNWAVQNTGTDPFQLSNLVGSPAHADALHHFRRMLRERMAELNDTFPPSTWYRDHWTRDRNVLRGARGGTHDLAALERLIRAHFPG